MNRHSVLMLFFSMAALATSSFAQPTPPTTAPQLCAPLADMCAKAGFSRDNIPGKNIYANCVGPLMAGKTIANITADPKLIENCKADVENQPCTKILNLCRDRGFTGGPKRLPLFDCFFPLMTGKAVDGVTPSTDTYQACKATFDQEIKQQPCLRIMMACRSGGYSPDAVNGELFARNCYNPLLAGQYVSGVYIDPATVKACRAMSPSPPTVPQ